MLRSIKSSQRRTRLIALRIEGSTGTPSLEGLDKEQCTIADTAEGHYTITFKKPFAAAPHAVSSTEVVDREVCLTTTSSTCVVKVYNTFTGALADGDAQLLIIGSDITDRY